MQPKPTEVTLEAGAAEGPVAELDGGAGRRIAGLRLEDAEGGGCTGKRSEQAGGNAGGEEIATGGLGRHEDTSTLWSAHSVESASRGA